jgi:anti-sigma regulatory factor (Ser/Thr protein kinase)
MKPQVRDLLVLIDASSQCKSALERLTFVPRLRVQHLSEPPDPETNSSEPLVYLLGHTASLQTSQALLTWLDRLREADGAPVAFVLPRPDQKWCPGSTHPQFCGLLPCEPDIPIEAMERILCRARENIASRWGEGMVRRAALSWTLTSREAADPEQAWLLVDSILGDIIGSSADLSCLGMAFSEALTNAVEHGNLELDSALKDGTEEGLLHFFKERERRLTDPHYGERRIRLTVALRRSNLQIQIRNEGCGFSPARGIRLGGVPSGSLNHGLGLAMIESLVDRVTLSPDGRTITLVQTLPRDRLRLGRHNLDLLHGQDRDRAAA